MGRLGPDCDGLCQSSALVVLRAAGSLKTGAVVVGRCVQCAPSVSSRRRRTSAMPGWRRGTTSEASSVSKVGAATTMRGQRESLSAAFCTRQGAVPNAQPNKSNVCLHVRHGNGVQNAVIGHQKANVVGAPDGLGCSPSPYVSPTLRMLSRRCTRAVVTCATHSRPSGRRGNHDLSCMLFCPLVPSKTCG